MKILFRVLILLASCAAFAREVWIPRAYAIGAPYRGCSHLRWRDDVVFFNATDREQVVQLLDSTGLYYGPLTLPSHRQYSLRFNAQGESALGLWVDHVSVADGVTVAARLGLGIDDNDCNIGAPPDLSPLLGETSLPIFDELVPAGVTQTILGTNLGSVPSRLNVMLFNASENEAHFVVEFHGGCDDAHAPSNFSIRPREIRQVALGTIETGCTSPRYAEPYSSYVTVVSDEPGFSFVSVLPRDAAPTIGFAIVK